MGKSSIADAIVSSLCLTRLPSIDVIETRPLTLPSAVLAPLDSTFFSAEIPVEAPIAQRLRSRVWSASGGGPLETRMLTIATGTVNPDPEGLRCAQAASCKNSRPPAWQPSAPPQASTEVDSRIAVNEPATLSTARGDPSSTVTPRSGQAVAHLSLVLSILDPRGFSHRVARLQRHGAARLGEEDESRAARASVA
ncbi:hypothetical protein VTO73DRAFT_11777 [Trametes versicolor]